MRLTFGQIKNSRIPHMLSMCPTDARLAQFVNEAQETMITWGKWWGSYQRYRVCLSAGCITWPRHIAAIEAVAVCDNPGIVRNEWFEFAENSFGLLDGDEGSGTQLIDRGMAATFEDINGATDKKVRVTADISEDATAKMTVMGYDHNGNWVRTQDADNNWLDGEQIAISSNGTNSTNKFSYITGVQKPVTNGMVRLYSYDVDDGAQVALGYYEWDEEAPMYRRSLIPNLENFAVCDNTDADNCTKKVVTVMAKMRHIPVSKDSDYMILTCLPAFKDMCMSIKAKEDNEIERALILEASARDKLNKELSHYLGDAQIISIRTQHRDAWGGGGVDNLI